MAKVDRTLLIDCHSICYRVLHSIGDLSYNEQDTGVIFGFLRQIQKLAEKFDYPKFIFAWDSKKSFRKEIYPNYKHKDKIDPEMQQLLSIGKPQFYIIRDRILLTLGFNNSFVQTGLEADDIIAQIVIQYPPGFWFPINEGRKYTIISGDNDLYQLLGIEQQDYIEIHDPKSDKTVNAISFEQQYKIPPRQWAYVKSIAGCPGDGIPGILGIGEKSAIKYLKGELREKKLQKIENEESQKLIYLFHKLVTLPFNKIQPISLLPDALNIGMFESVCLEYGLHSLLRKDNYNTWKRILK